MGRFSLIFFLARLYFLSILINLINLSEEELVDETGSSGFLAKLDLAMVLLIFDRLSIGRVANLRIKNMNS